MTDCHIPYLSDDEKVFLNTTATYSQARRMSSQEQNRPSIEDNHHHRRHQVHSPKAKELEILIFDQPQRTVRLSLTPRCAV
ncbi:hypothetical protein BCV72DRAFT_196341 [Rhizopus microsporus var. microsporus]|uniref:Uncharacterized protein n=1 Tax=Rhizopus microsporus var. microsporus TaxID=86635 RepID=A0A1X0RIW9_RHIZD|nr:hypothetical protein BCV72DRAFT_196341 [Rhizopus microsporus var. microsporus]